MNMEEQEYIDFKVEGIAAREELISKEHITFQLTIKFSEFLSHNECEIS